MWIKLCGGNYHECEQACHYWLWYGAQMFGTGDAEAREELCPHKLEGNAWRLQLYEGWGIS